ncbi:YNL162W-A [Zygosaccharomyces parabailii]|nr:YNL162W-A [Zygosaccharomyces parabailii]
MDKSSVSRSIRMSNSRAAAGHRSRLTNAETVCPDCGGPLQKCLIQQNYAIVICIKEDCGYPFNKKEVFDQLVYVDDQEILSVARKRLSQE